MVEIVVSLANGHNSGKDVIFGRPLVIKWCFTDPVSERVYTER